MLPIGLGANRIDAAARRPIRLSISSTMSIASRERRECSSITSAAAETLAVASRRESAKSLQVRYASPAIMPIEASTSPNLKRAAVVSRTERGFDIHHLTKLRIRRNPAVGNIRAGDKFHQRRPDTVSMIVILVKK